MPGPRVTASSDSWMPPPGEVTRPDQLPEGAWLAVDLFDGERVLRCWKTARGYLVLTSLRCLLLWQRRELFQHRDWESSPEVLLYSVKPPRVLFGRFVEIAPALDPAGSVIRAGVADPAEVADEISASLPAARQEWELRRHRALGNLAAHRMLHDRMTSAIALGLPPPVPEIPCAYCGNLMPVTAKSCPHCGAPGP
jgi:hypothetical protein